MMDNTTPQATYEVPRSRLLPTLILFVFVLGLLYTLFLVFQKMSLNGSVEELTTNKASVERKIEVLNDQQIQELFVAQELKNKLDEDTRRWSSVINGLQTLTPVSVFISNFAFGEDGSITVSGFGDSYGSVADLISALETSSNFVGPFVPSISQGTTSDGQAVVSFSMTLELSSQ